MGERSCLLSATPQSLYQQLTPRLEINSAAQQIRAYCICILHLPVRHPDELLSCSCDVTQGGKG